ncbi:hypothetical protein M3J09_008987 [Ascochyta lentis]
MLALTGLLGIISCPLVARIDKTWAAALALMVSVVGFGLSIVSQAWW